MKITADEYKKYIKDEYIRSYTHYQAMVLLAKQQGVDTDDVPTPTPDPTPTPEPDPTPTPTPTPDPDPTPKPSGTDPEFYLDGQSSYTIKRGEHAYFTVYVFNVSDYHEFNCTVNGEPAYIHVDDKWNKISNGYKIDCDVRGINIGIGEYCLYWKGDIKNKDKWFKVRIVVNG